jgi:hypothetical protein
VVGYLCQKSNRPILSCYDDAVLPCMLSDLAMSGALATCRLRCRVSSSGISSTSSKAASNAFSSRTVLRSQISSLLGLSAYFASSFCLYQSFINSLLTAAGFVLVRMQNQNCDHCSLHCLNSPYRYRLMNCPPGPRQYIAVSKASRHDIVSG